MTNLDMEFSARFTFGEPRMIEEHDRYPTYVHRSVKYRMENSNYKPRARLPTKRLKWVD